MPALKLNEPCAMDELTDASTMTNRYDGIGFAVHDQRRCSDSMGVSGEQPTGVAARQPRHVP